MALTGSSRPLSSLYSPDIDVEFRHDPPGRPFSWGAVWRVHHEGEVYLVDEVDWARVDGFLSLFAETTAVRGLKIRLDLRNADVRRSHRYRSFFDPDRAGILVRTEERFTRVPTFIALRVSGTF